MLKRKLQKSKESETCIQMIRICKITTRNKRSLPNQIPRDQTFRGFFWSTPVFATYHNPSSSSFQSVIATQESLP